jgi:hypothetical protein
MAYEDVGEICVTDELEPRIEGIETVARQLMLDAQSPVDLGRFPTEVQGTDDRTWLRAEYVLEGNELNELPTRSRYVSVTLDPQGIQVAVLPFSEAGIVTIPGTASDTAPDVETVPPGEIEKPVCVDFFSMLLAEAGVRLEGMQTVATEEELDMLTESLTHPALQELVTSRQQLKYMALGFVAVSRSLGRRDVARLEFLDRKTEAAVKMAAEDVETLIKREKEVRRRIDREQS